MSAFVVPLTMCHLTSQKWHNLLSQWPFGMFKKVMNFCLHDIKTWLNWHSTFDAWNIKLLKTNICNSGNGFLIPKCHSLKHKFYCILLECHESESESLTVCLVWSWTLSEKHAGQRFWFLQSFIWPWKQLVHIWQSLWQGSEIQCIKNKKLFIPKHTGVFEWDWVCKGNPQTKKEWIMLWCCMEQFWWNKIWNELWHLKWCRVCKRYFNRLALGLNKIASISKHLMVGALNPCWVWKISLFQFFQGMSEWKCKMAIWGDVQSLAPGTQTCSETHRFSILMLKL